VISARCSLAIHVRQDNSTTSPNGQCPIDAPARPYAAAFHSPFGEVYKGLAWLFLGVANTDALLYDDDWQKIKSEFPDNFRLDYALSREQTNKDGGKMYIQDKVAEYSDEIFTRMDNGAHMYFCGLKGMMPGITEMLEGVSKEKGIVWEDKLKEWKKAGQWHVEVY